MPRGGPRYSEEAAREAIALSRSYAESLRRLGVRDAGGNHRILRKYADRIWLIPTDHFDPNAGRRKSPTGRATPLEIHLVEHSTYSRSHLKKRLYASGLKHRACEICGQGEEWQGRRMALILDHINGVATDNRLENLRIVCPNCAATFETHCGSNRLPMRPCKRCQVDFKPKYRLELHCSPCCRSRSARTPRPETRKVQRPEYNQLRAETADVGYLAVGRRYGVVGQRRTEVGSLVRAVATAARRGRLIRARAWQLGRRDEPDLARAAVRWPPSCPPTPPSSSWPRVTARVCAHRSRRCCTRSAAGRWCTG